IYAVGVDNLVLVDLKSRGIAATNTPGVLTEATADLAMALLLDAFRNVTRGDRLVRSGGWKGWSPTLLVGPRVTGANLGIIGFGRIGQAVARRAQGFSMRVMYTQRNRVSAETEQCLNATFTDLDELLEQSDVVSLHCPLTDSTRGMLNKSRLQKMRPGSILLNCARGPCVDEQALVELLSGGHIAAAGLDVYDREPDVSERLRSLDNVVLAPHLGSADLPTRVQMANMCADSVLDVLSGKEPKNLVRVV
ncbi:MAG: D-glycerate dehydrogenase, partial [Polyangiaceae bacterium]|nr:D-glycerate dehydrogenase [Polyangiaceae bacterium]